MSGSALPSVSRRTALLTALLSGSGCVAVALSACRAGTASDPVSGPVPSSVASSPAPTSDGDEELVRRALDRERQVRRDVLRAAQRHRSLRPALARTAEVHAAHADLLQRASEVTGAGPVARRVAGNPRSAAGALAADERVLAEAHARAAVEAASGPFARVLAAMAAAADQQAQLLDGLSASVQRRG